MRLTSIISALVGVVLLAAGVVLVAYLLLGRGLEGTATNSDDPAGFNVPEVDTAEETRSEAAGGPEDKVLKITIPKMARIEDDPVPNAEGDDEEALGENAAIHLKGTGFPWEKEANVYLAGHRLGYPNTESFLAFWDLDVLEDGDKVFVADAGGKRYTYRVFEELVVDPTDTWVTEPMPGKNVLTLQTCTLPDYAQRLVVRAELVDEEP